MPAYRVMNFRRSQNIDRRYFIRSKNLDWRYFSGKSPIFCSVHWTPLPVVRPTNDWLTSFILTPYCNLCSMKYVSLHFRKRKCLKHPWSAQFLRLGWIYLEWHFWSHLNAGFRTSNCFYWLIWAFFPRFPFEATQFIFSFFHTFLSQFFPFL